MYDHLDFVHGLNAYLDGFAGASTYAIRKGFHNAGVEDNQILIFSELMGSESVFLTANADTVYFLGIVDLMSGPMVVETAAAGARGDRRHVVGVDHRLRPVGPGSRRRRPLPARPTRLRRPAAGQRLPRGRSRTSRALLLGRSFLTDNDPAPTVATIKSTTKVYPYAQGGHGTSVATLLEGGHGAPAPAAAIPETVFVEGSRKAFNTVPPSDFGFFELMNEVVQDEPSGSANTELMGHLAAIGIVKGEPFEPDERMRRTLEDAAAVGNATSRTLYFDPRASEGFTYYDGSGWFNPLWVGGYTFETPPPLVTKEGIKPFPTTGVRKQHSRTAFLYAATGVTPAMCMRLTGIGSQYLMTVKDADGTASTAGRATG